MEVNVPHRHSDKADEAISTLIELGKEATSPPSSSSDDDACGVVSCLEASGWTYLSENQGIRIFNKDANGGTGDDALNLGALPWFRGEGWIAGRWKLEDVQATVRSLGARAAWDPRLDSLQSKVVDLLSPTDTLSHVFVRPSFPVGARNACVLTTKRVEDKVGYVASVSVEDPLIPPVGSRTIIHLNGFVLRALQRPPLFDPPPTEGSNHNSPTAAKGTHHRNKSSLSALHPSEPMLNRRASQPLLGSTPANPSYPPRPPHVRNNSSRSQARSSTSTNSVPDLSGSHEIRPFVPSHLPSKSFDQNTQPLNSPGMHVSFIVRASLGGNLPETYVNSLSHELPLSIAAIDRYLSTHGFAPYLIKSRLKQGLRVLEEQFDATSATYRVIYRCDESIKSEETTVRFHGASFPRGFNVEVLGALDWRIAYDVEPLTPPDILKESTKPTTSGHQRRTSMSIVTPSISSANITGFNFGSSSTPATKSASVDPVVPDTSPDLSSDLASAPGPLGGCTLIIPNNTESAVSISITRTSERLRAPIDRMRQTSRALGSASVVASYGRQSETIEELLESSHGEGQARAGLKLARQVLETMAKARQEEIEKEELRVKTAQRDNQLANNLVESASSNPFASEWEGRPALVHMRPSGGLAGRRSASAKRSISGLDAVAEVESAA